MMFSLFFSLAETRRGESGIFPSILPEADGERANNWIQQVAFGTGEDDAASSKCNCFSTYV